MSFDPDTSLPPGAKIKVIGVGGGGGNAVNTMIKSGLEGVDFVTSNTDVQALRNSLAENKVQIGKELTRGLGAGADPDIGRDAALEDRHEIQNFLEGADMVFITAGMGGGTGTGGASVVAQIARELGALTVAVVTKPFQFEGKRRRKHADLGVQRLRECVDTLITIPNQRLLQVAAPNVSMMDAFRMADEVLVNAVRGISDIINIPGTVNVDFADVKTVMSCMGQALMGIGVGEGEGRAAVAAAGAISSPLLEDIDIEGATGILINITAGEDITLMEVNEACSVVQEAAHEEANIIFGAVIDPNLGDQIRVTVIATGFPVDQEQTDDNSVFVPKVQQGQPILHHAPFPSRLTTPNLTGVPRSPAQPHAQPHSPAQPPAQPQRAGAQTTERPEERRILTEQAPAVEPQRAEEPQNLAHTPEPHFPKTEPVVASAAPVPPSALIEPQPLAPQATVEPAQAENSLLIEDDLNLGGAPLQEPALTAPAPEATMQPPPLPVEEPLASAPIEATSVATEPELPLEDDLEELANWTMSSLDSPSLGANYFAADEDDSDLAEIELAEPEAPRMAPRVSLSNQGVSPEDPDDTEPDAAELPLAAEPATELAPPAPMLSSDIDLAPEPVLPSEPAGVPEPALQNETVLPNEAVLPNETEVIINAPQADLSPSHIFADEGADQAPVVSEEVAVPPPLVRSGATANLEHEPELGSDDQAEELERDMPLESYFGSDETLAGDIDRKIDEALELAERMRNQDETKKQDDDDLDVPAFLRNGMKDLPLD